MKEDTNFETQDFFEKVLGEYRSVKNYEYFEDLMAQPEPDFSESKWKFISLSMIKLSELLGRKGIKIAKEKQKYNKYLKVSENLLTQPEIREILSDSIKNSEEILSENNLIKIVTEDLNRGNLKKRFEIPSEPLLFALIVHRIIKIGRQNFCE